MVLLMDLPPNLHISDLVDKLVAQWCDENRSCPATIQGGARLVDAPRSEREARDRLFCAASCRTLSSDKESSDKKVRRAAGCEKDCHQPPEEGFQVRLVLVAFLLQKWSLPLHFAGLRRRSLQPLVELLLWRSARCGGGGPSCDVSFELDEFQQRKSDQSDWSNAPDRRCELL